MTDAEIDKRAFAIQWEITGMCWKAAEEIGCMDEYIKLSVMAWMRVEIIRTFERMAFFPLRRRMLSPQ